MVVGKADISAMNTLRSFFTGMVTPVADVVSLPVRGLYAMLEGVQSVASLREENTKLKKDLRRLSRWRREAELLQSDNRQLRSVVGLIEPPGMRAVTVRAVAVNADSFAHTVLVRAGTRDGIHIGNAAVTNEGLVGIVVETGPSHARLLLITDINAMIPVMLTSSAWPAVAVGRNSTELMLQFLAAEATPSLGELVQTSGHGGVLPAGIPVARIKSIRERQITLEPLADLQRLGYLSILVSSDSLPVADPIDAPSFKPVPDTDKGFSLEGMTSSGRRVDEVVE